MNTAKGISLITLMVVIAILAVIAAIAISVWRSQLARDHVADALETADAAKLVVMEAATTAGGLSRVKASELGYKLGVTTHEYVAKLEISDGGRITLTTKNTGTTPSPVLVLTPSENAADSNTSPISWSCAMAVGDPAMTPPSCDDANAPEATRPTPAASAAKAHSS